MSVLRARRAQIALAALAGCLAIRPSAGGGELSARAVDVADVTVPAGYRVEAVATGLSAPTGVTFDDRGGVYVVEAGDAASPPRVVEIMLDGTLRTAVLGDAAPWTGAVWTPDGFVVTEGGAGRIVRIGLDGAVTTLVAGLPARGDHPTNGPVVGPDGAVYFGQGTVTNAGVVSGDEPWLADHPGAHDVPCADVTLAGVAYRSKARGGAFARTGAFVPHGTSTWEGMVVRGSPRCSGAVLRIGPRGGQPEVVAWGFRDPAGLAFAADGTLYVTDDGPDAEGSRRVWGAADHLWRVERGRWYGWPDFSGGRPLDDHRFAVPGDPVPAPLLARLPGAPPKPVARFPSGAGAHGVAFPTRAGWGDANDAYVALSGDLSAAPGAAPRSAGFQVVRVDVRTGTVDAFASNRGGQPGPASRLGTRGLERPVAVAFDPLRGDLWIVDRGVVAVGDRGPLAGTGVLWRVRREGAPLVAR